MIQTNYKAINSLKRSILILLMSIVTLGVGFTQSVEELARAYINKSLDYIIDPEIINQLKQESEERVIEAFVPYCTDTIPRVRWTAYQMLQKIGVGAKNDKVRQDVVKFLVKGLKDSDGGNIGVVAGYLSDFSSEDFDLEQRYEITIQVKEKPAPPYLHKLILLTGYLNMEELIYDYTQMLVDSVNYSEREKRNMLLAKARMNDANSLQQIIRSIKRMQINDDVVYEVYPRLAYVRKKESFEILFDEILNDEKNCRSSNPDNEAPIVCAFRIIAYVAPYIKDFPIKVDSWGEPIIEDYDSALITARSWIKSNRENYELINDKY